MRGVCKHFDTKIYYVCAIAIIMVTVANSWQVGESAWKEAWLQFKKV